MSLASQALVFAQKPCTLAGEWNKNNVFVLVSIWLKLRSSFSVAGRKDRLTGYSIILIRVAVVPPTKLFRTSKCHHFKGDQNQGRSQDLFSGGEG